MEASEGRIWQLWKRNIIFFSFFLLSVQRSKLKFLHLQSWFLLRYRLDELKPEGYIWSKLKISSKFKMGKYIPRFHSFKRKHSQFYPQGVGEIGWLVKLFLTPFQTSIAKFRRCFSVFYISINCFSVFYIPINCFSASRKNRMGYSWKWNSKRIVTILKLQNQKSKITNSVK